MGLELKHLAAYLPYKVQYQLYGNFPIKKGVNNIVENIAEVTTQNFMRILDDYDKNRKPILRPLSDLIKEINIKGDVFIPLVTLCRDFGKREPCNISFGIQYLMHADNGGGLKWWFLYNKENKSFELTDDDKEMNDYCLPQYDMMAKLFEWHFDVFDLINKGLAVNIHDLTPTKLSL